MFSQPTNFFDALEHMVVEAVFQAEDEKKDVVGAKAVRDITHVMLKLLNDPKLAGDYDETLARLNVLAKCASWLLGLSVALTYPGSFETNEKEHQEIICSEASKASRMLVNAIRSYAGLSQDAMSH